MSGCGNDKCNCGPSCTGCNCSNKKTMGDFSISMGSECDIVGCGCSSCNNCAAPCGCTSCASSH